MFQRSPFGSSPLTRGTRQEIEKSESWKGLIPARAGNTTGKFHPGGKGTAHPRLCWEHGTPFSVSQAALGSSPLAQGTFLEGLLCLRPARLIPARAGNTSGRGGHGVLSSAHPRSRGEHAARYVARLWVIGSSPLARGTRLQHLIQLFAFRLIPARAGNTVVRCLKVAPPSAHPRSRGEHREDREEWYSHQGSSPLARGTRNVNRLQAVEARLIPARAGNISRLS